MEAHNSNRNALIPGIAAVAVIIGIFAGIVISRVDMGNLFGRMRTAAAPPQSDKLDSVLSLIRSEYVEDVNMDTLTERILPTLLESLDPHSTYIPAKDLADVNESLEGHFDGIGVTFNMLTDTAMVFNVISGGPSARAGVQPGDRIMTINDSLVAGRKIRQEDIIKRLRGPRGSMVKLGVERVGISGLTPITITRGVIPVKSLDASLMLEPGVGYIKLSRFSRTSHREILDATAELRKQGMKKLVFDLRENSGGFLDQAILITNEFLPANTLIVYTEGKASPREDQYGNGKGTLQDVELTILIDEGSASASEIVAGAIQDNDRGTIIGRRSFGKGLVQLQIPLDDGSAIRLTTARYYTPVGRCIQKPYDEGLESYNQDLDNRYNHSELFSVDSIRFDESMKFTTPKGRTVYGGGGIMPDVFVPIDTSSLNPYLREVIGRNILLLYSFEFSDNHRSQLNRIKTMAEIEAYFRPMGDMVPGLVAFASRNGISPKEGELDGPWHELLQAEIKAYIARNTALEDSGFIHFIHPVDNVIVKTLEILK
ncbi:MAG: S41 family peptidase [Rikenellaceae bacterium]|jgi:carboxyl-terminal processing protease|nr:S41 family peptidase [Rikenellaceae bacterium]